MLVFVLLAVVTINYAATWTWNCNGEVYSITMDSEQISLDDQYAIAVAARDAVC